MIFVLHRVAPAGARVIDPDATVSAPLLAAAVRVVLTHGFDVIGLDDVPERLTAVRSRRFAVFSFDDGYRDNLQVGKPIFDAFGVPWSLYITTGLVDRTMSYWWGAVSRLVEREPELDLRPLGIDLAARPATWQDRQELYARIQTWVHADLERRTGEVMDWCSSHGVEARLAMDEDALSWGEVRHLARAPGVTLGAHTVSHPRLSQLDLGSLTHELVGARDRLAQQTGVPIRHLAYPYGGVAACGQREFMAARAAGFVTGTTTRRGNLFGAHRGQLMALPRRRLVEGAPRLATVRRALNGTAWIERRGPVVVTA